MLSIWFPAAFLARMLSAARAYFSGADNDTGQHFQINLTYTETHPGVVELAKRAVEGILVEVV